jgi:hypothetical protein
MSRTAFWRFTTSSTSIWPSPIARSRSRALRGRDGKRKGYVAIIEASDFDDAEAWLGQSPFYTNNLYDRVEVAEFVPEVGYVE